MIIKYDLFYTLLLLHTLSENYNKMFNVSKRIARLAKSTNLMTTPQRGIKLHEYQAGNLLASFNVSIPLGEVAKTADEAKTIASKFENGCVVKSQILGGGRGMGHIKETGF